MVRPPSLWQILDPPLEGETKCEGTWKWDCGRNEKRKRKKRECGEREGGMERGISLPRSFLKVGAYGPVQRRAYISNQWKVRRAGVPTFTW